MDKTKQIKLIKGTHVASNLTLQYTNALDIISYGQKRPLPGYEHRSKSAMSFNLRQDSQNHTFFWRISIFFRQWVSTVASGDREIT